MRITIINTERKEKRYTRVDLEEFVAQLKDGTYRHQYIRDFDKEVCFAAEWMKTAGELKAKTVNPLVLLSIENLRDLATAEEYKQRAGIIPYTLLAFIGHDGHSLRIVCPYAVTGGEPTAVAPQRLSQTARDLRLTTRHTRHRTGAHVRDLLHDSL